MSRPEIAKGAIEQALYTWSDITASGMRGQGFAELSPGLQSSAEWLSALDTGRFQPLAPEIVAHGLRPYEEWGRLVTVGSFQVGTISFVYRKIARAGIDAHGRDRFVVHLLVGRQEEFGLASVAESDSHWLTAEQCPLDALPRLSTLKLDEFSPATNGHRCAAVDILAGRVADAWATQRDKLEWGTVPGEGLTPFTAALLTLIPTVLWSSIDLDWRVGPAGPKAEVTISADVSEVAVSAEGAGPALPECLFHRTAESAWADMRPGQRGWPEFLKLLNDRRNHRQPPSNGNATANQPTPLALGSREVLVRIMNDMAGDPDGPLSDGAAERAFRHLEGFSNPSGGWISVTNQSDLRRLLGGISKSPTFRRSVFFLNEDSAETEVVGAWRRTGLAAIGVAVLGHPDGEKILAPPEVEDPEQMRAVFSYLLRTEPSREQLGGLLRNQFGASERARRQAITALRDAGLTPREIFGEVLLSAALPPARLLDFIRENVDEFAAWVHLPDPYREALRIGVARHRLLRRGLRH